jgi:hypothetical protein
MNISIDVLLNADHYHIIKWTSTPDDLLKFRELKSEPNIQKLIFGTSYLILSKSESPAFYYPEEYMARIINDMRIAQTVDDLLRMMDHHLNYYINRGREHDDNLISTSEYEDFRNPSALTMAFNATQKLKKRNLESN